mmetsp:Transcript_28682/g.27676  ORF Transcript_28682/g.27676 Transcript_28682/m.27676 type:complete len:114 (-) Transcript_28682:1686-2027(-)
MNRDYNLNQTNYTASEALGKTLNSEMDANENPYSKKTLNTADLTPDVDKPKKSPEKPNEQANQAPKLEPTKRLLKYLGKEWKLFSLGILSLLLGTLGGFATPLYVGWVIDDLE